jgi:lysozyme
MHYGLPVAEERPDWLFSDSGRPGQGDWAVWQLRFDGTVPGITKKVDVDVARPEILRETARL